MVHISNSSQTLHNACCHWPPLLMVMLTLLMQVFHTVLSKRCRRDAPGSQGFVIDVGGNYGWFSLLSAALGCRWVSPFLLRDLQLGLPMPMDQPCRAQWLPTAALNDSNSSSRRSRCRPKQHRECTLLEITDHYNGLNSHNLPTAVAHVMHNPGGYQLQAACLGETCRVPRCAVLCDVM
jgi:hypothetical protein